MPRRAAPERPKPITDAAIARALLAAVEERAPRTICPSEVARALDAEMWRPLMPRVRAAAARLAARGKVVVTQRGQPVELETVRGPVRIALRRPA